MIRPLCSPGSPNSYKRPPPSLGTPDLTSPSSDGALPSQSTLSPSSPCSDLPNLVQSTSFLDSVPVTLTMEPRDWSGGEDGSAQWNRTAAMNLGAVSKSHVDTRANISSRAMDVELRRRPGEGFGFVIASQEVVNGMQCWDWWFLLSQPDVNECYASDAQSLVLVLSSASQRSLSSPQLNRATAARKSSVLPSKPCGVCKNSLFTRLIGSQFRGNPPSREKNRLLDNTGASSLVSHRFVTVRRGSPAARSGQIQPGDQLEAVEGRSVVTLPHRDLAQILRRAGNTLRLTIVPRSHTNNNLPEYPDFDAESRLRKSHRAKQKDSQYYSVDLDRGPTGFGFSLRGGSEYNMGLYVLGLMEGGPASRSQKIQVSDQLVEINGDSTAGMTHSQAVEQIRKGGARIHLILKKGNGYVPDYDHEAGTASPSSVFSGEPVAAVNGGSLRSSRWVDDGGLERRERRGKGRRQTSGEEGGRRKEQETHSRSLPGTLRGQDGSRREEDGKQRERHRGRQKSKSVRERRRIVSDVSSERENGVPSDGERERGRVVKEKRDKIRTSTTEIPLRAPFSFLMPLDNDDDWSGAESTKSFSEVSISAASIAFLGSTLDTSGSSTASPGPWLVPSPHKLSQVLEGKRLSQNKGGLWS
ncbi:hypothetical protein DNTS_023094 [Danionella cerebrum]|uniref:PDZ domain-containing protein n=1 Tax=Danionella cerebrum TaxID=2873325 RepID=A0A553QSM4_9TELE|nr:hypothetical protein DNTS_023094 [Danionella translucida]